jgi:hypothetical protein
VFEKGHQLHRDPEHCRLRLSSRIAFVVNVIPR